MKQQLMEGVAGGIVGMKQSSSQTLYINNCENKGRIISNVSGESYIGGIIGYAHSNVSILNCNNLQDIKQTGEVTGYSGAGGIVGYIAMGNVNIFNSYNQGKVSSTRYAGGLTGLAGWAQRYIINCYNTGEVTGESAGGLAGNIGGNNELLVTKNCYYLNTNGEKAIGNWNTTQESQEDITGKNESELKSGEILNTFNEIEASSDYDITTFKKWVAGENGYPAFQR